jgi:hypothetical protein
MEAHTHVYVNTLDYLNVDGATDIDAIGSRRKDARVELSLSLTPGKAYGNVREALTLQIRRWRTKDASFSDDFEVEEHLVVFNNGGMS